MIVFVLTFAFFSCIRHDWAEVCKISSDEFFFRRMIFKTIKNMQNSDFRQKPNFFLQTKNLMFDQNRPFMDEIVKLSCKLKMRHIYGLWFLVSVT